MAVGVFGLFKNILSSFSSRRMQLWADTVKYCINGLGANEDEEDCSCQNFYACRSCSYHVRTNAME